MHGMAFTSGGAAKDEVMNWIQFYNSKRLHSTLGYLSPMHYERKRLGEVEKLAA